MPLVFKKVFIMRIELVVISLLLASCSGIAKLPSFTPHKIEIRQGNLVTPEMRDKLKAGMIKTQVRAVLGTPLINDVFHASRWDFVYRLEQNSKLTEQQRMTLYFDGEVLTRIDEGNMPARPLGAAPAIAAPIESAPVAALSAVIEAAPVSSVTQAQQPAPEAVPVVAVAIPTEQQVADAVKDWAAVWSAQDVAKYLAHYALDFKPAGRLSHVAWESQRRERIARAKSIQVELSDIKVSMRGESRASVNFTQNYRADNYQDKTRKTLELEKTGDEWLIVTEQVAGK